MKIVLIYVVLAAGWWLVEQSPPRDECGLARTQAEATWQGGWKTAQLVGAAAQVQCQAAVDSGE